MPDSDIQLIKDKLDLVDFISEYVQLKPAGVNHKARCPFHQEKTPSFMVNRERQFWHCFGCNKGGDIFTFLQEMEGMEFVEALDYLAKRAGVVLANFRKSEVNASQRARLKEINTEAARFFHNFLLKMDASKSAREYLKNRGVKDEIIVDWQIGYIPDQWDLLTQYMLKKGFGIEDLIASGLTVRREEGHETSSGRASRGFYDRFRGRIMFPICNVHGEAVGFTGRILIEKENSGGKPGSNEFAPGKYINTPQTIIFDKSQLIFGLHRAKQEIKAKDIAVMVEGQMDVIACHQAGMKNVVASSGTALTQEQVKLLKRYSNNLNIAFDIDTAGQNAAERGIETALAEGLNVKVIRIPDSAGKDADECLKKNPDVWFKAVENAQEIMEWYFARALASKNLSDPKQKQAVANELLPKIFLLPYAVEQDHWLKKLAEKLDLEVEVLREEKKRLAKKKQGAIYPNKEKEESKEFKILEKTRLDLLVERLLMLILKFPNLFFEFYSFLPENAIVHRFALLYTNLKEQYNNGVLNIGDLRQNLARQGKENELDVLQMGGDLEFAGVDEIAAKNEIEATLRAIKNEWKKKRRQEIQREIDNAEKIKDHKKVADLMKEFQELS